MNGVSTKVEKIDLRYVLKNYLKKELWEKTWNIFEYNKLTIQVNLLSIEIKRKVITLEITIKTNRAGYFHDYEYSGQVPIPFEKEHENIELFEKQIFQRSKRIMLQIEYSKLKRQRSEKLDKISEIEEEINEILEKIATNYLDEKKVSNEKIRDAYIYDFINQNNPSDLEDNYIDYSAYSLLGNEIKMMALFFGYNDEKELMDIEDLENRKSKKELEKEIDERMKEIKSGSFEREAKDRLERIFEDEDDDDEY